ncbi:hypothetical protein [uncultured Alistipes sp.]|uniref:hypothetical protein n=1 Tax=uncultured Alistipes sp. TaxID=538949 RepID=UPI002592C420|nr:hypothetical protein [uncultured Alistipes sp.]
MELTEPFRILPGTCAGGTAGMISGLQSPDIFITFSPAQLRPRPVFPGISEKMHFFEKKVKTD